MAVFSRHLSNMECYLCKTTIKFNIKAFFVQRYLAIRKLQEKSVYESKIFFYKLCSQLNSMKISVVNHETVKPSITNSTLRILGNFFKPNYLAIPLLQLLLLLAIQKILLPPTVP